MRGDKDRGFALIDLVFVCGIIGMLCGIALPRLLQAKQSAGAASAIGSLRTINSAELTYALTCGGGFYAPALTTLGVAPPGSHEPYLTGGLTASNSVVKGNYVITLQGTPFTGSPPTCNGLASGESSQGFRSGADPAAPGSSRFFSSNANGTIFEHTSTLFSSMPEIGEPSIGHPLR